MSLTLASMLLLAQNCAPTVAPETLISVAHVESRFDLLTIGVNGRTPRALHPATREAAIAAASRLITAGANIDLGLAQINSKNLGWLGLTVADAFDPCRNLAAAAKVLVANYTGTSQTSPGEQAALRAAISMYNTGDRSRGFRNGYVQKVSRAAAYIVPALTPESGHQEPPLALSAPTPEAAPPVMLTAAEPAPPSWDVFASSESRDVLVFKTSAKAAAPRPLPSTRKAPGARHDP
jgi:type IV secretion system protein VirB1